VNGIPVHPFPQLVIIEVNVTTVVETAVGPLLGITVGTIENVAAANNKQENRKRV
jgi:hypothetical protein